MIEISFIITLAVFPYTLSFITLHIKLRVLWLSDKKDISVPIWPYATFPFSFLIRRKILILQ